MEKARRILWERFHTHNGSKRMVSLVSLDVDDSRGGMVLSMPDGTLAVIEFV